MRAAPVPRVAHTATMDASAINALCDVFHITPGRAPSFLRDKPKPQAARGRRCLERHVMTTAPVFISHRSEYARIARALKKTIEVTSQGQLDVFISEDIPRGNDWREAIEAHLNAAQSLFLIYGAPYEDWSWCFYETGYFAAAKGNVTGRQIYCLTRPDMAAPGPLAHLQMVTGTHDLTKELMELYERNNIDFDATELRADVSKLEKGLFGALRQFDGYPRLKLTAQEADFTGKREMPASAMFAGDR